MRFIVILTILTGLGVAKGGNASISSHDKLVFCSVYAEPSTGFFDSFGNKFKMDNVDWNLCTHLIYIHMISYVFEKPWDKTNSFTEENYKQISSLKNKFPHLKVSLGFKQSPAEYLKTSAQPEGRHQFINSAVNFMLRHNFDGLNLIWSYENDEPFGKKKFVRFVKKLHEEFKLHNFSLSFTFIKTRNFAVPQGFLSMSNHVDFLLIHPNFVKNLIKMRVPKSKMIMTIEFGSGNFGYYAACNLFMKNEGWKKSYDSKIGAAIASRNTESGQIKRIVFPSSRSVANIVRRAVRKNLAGIMAYTIDSDDSQGKCDIDNDTFNDFGTKQGVNLLIPTRINTSFPLLRTINEAITVATEELEQEEHLKESR